MTFGKTRVSSKGQVVIPAQVREKLELAPGEVLTVELGPPGERAIVLRGRSTSELEHLLQKGYWWIERSGEDLLGALSEARRKARRRERRRR